MEIAKTLFYKPMGVSIAMLMLLIVSSGLTPHETKAEFIKGLYLLAPLQKEIIIINKFADTKGIAGFSIAKEWPDIEAVEGSYDWKDIDAAVLLAKRAGKQISLCILPGVSTPDWVYEKGAKPFEFMDTFPSHGKKFYPEGHRFSTYGKTLNIPVPWDEIFLSAWERLIAAFGDHCKGMDNIAMVHLSGPTRHSPEMHLPRDGQDKQKWKVLGYSPEKLIFAWKRCIDAYAAAFPKTPLALHLSPVIFRDEVLEAVAGYAYKTYGQRIFMQNDILRARNNMDRADWAVIKKYSQKTTIGFQRGPLRIKGWQDLSLDEKLKYRRMHFEGLLNNGIDLGAKYIEVGFPDVKAFPDIVIEVAGKLKNQ